MDSSALHPFTLGIRAVQILPFRHPSGCGVPLRGGRGAGLIATEDLLIDIDGKLNNSGAIVASGLASISASYILNQRLIDLDERDRALAGGRGDGGLISAGTLFMATDGDLMNRGGTLASAGDIDLRIGG